MRIPIRLGEELLDGGEHHASGLHRELATKVGPIFRLGWRLAQQVLATREVPKSWSSRSLRSVRTTMVGFSMTGSRMMTPA